MPQKRNAMDGQIKRRRKVSYDYELAESIGKEPARIHENIAYFLSENQKAGRNFRDGTYWFYSTYEEMKEKVGLSSMKQLRTTLAFLEDNGFLIVAHYSFGPRNRTNWYTIPESIMQEYYPEFDYHLPTNTSALSDDCSALEDRTNNKDTNKDTKEKEIILPDKEKESPSYRRILDNDSLTPQQKETALRWLDGWCTIEPRLRDDVEAVKQIHNLCKSRGRERVIEEYRKIQGNKMPILMNAIQLVTESFTDPSPLPF